jgi:hypothetical protein
MTGLTPDIINVSVVRHGVLDLTFADGLRGEVEVLDRMRGPVFTQARTVAGFASVEVDPESGTVVWPAGQIWRLTRFTSVFELACGPSGAAPPPELGRVNSSERKQA